MTVPRPSYPMIPRNLLADMARQAGVKDPGIVDLLTSIMDKQAIDERTNYLQLDADILSAIASIPAATSVPLTPGLTAFTYARGVGTAAIQATPQVLYTVPTGKKSLIFSIRAFWATGTP